MRRSATLGWILLSCTAVALHGSSASGQEKSKSARPSQAKPAQRAKQISKRTPEGQLSDADCRAYAVLVAKAIATGNAASLNELIDWDSLFRITLKGIEITPKLRQDLTTGLKTGLSREAGFSGQLVKNSREGGSFDLLRLRQERNRQAILFRLIQPAATGGVAYYEFLPEKSADGKTRAGDIYVFSSGELLSEMLRRGILPVIANENRNFLDKLVTGERDYISDLPKFSETAQLISDGKMKEGLALIKGMKPETQKHKSVFLLRLRAAQAIDENEYAATIDEYRKLFPKDPGLDLLSISYYTNKKDFKQALECIDRVDVAVGGDPYLNVTRAALCDVQGKHDEAKRLARKATVAEPSLLPAYLELLGVSLIQKNYDDTLATLKEIDQKFQLKLNDLTKVREYAEFVKSPQYKEWLKYRQQKSKSA